MADLIRTTRLDSGIGVVTESMAGSHAVSIGFWVDAGSRDEEPAIAGASHFLEHLLFKGTEDRSAKEIAEAIDAVGGDMNAFTTKEYTAFYVRVLDSDLDLAVEILCDIMANPSFRPDEVEAERQVIVEEILMHEDEPSDLVHEIFSGAMFPDHPLGRPVLGDQGTIGAMTREQIAGYFTSMYRPGSIVVAAAGNVDHDRLVAAIESNFHPRLGDRPVRQKASLRPARPVVVTERKTEQAHLVVGTRALDRNDEDRFTFAVLNQILGGGMSSRLFQEIREKRGLVYSVYSYRAAYLEGGALSIYAGTSPARAHEVLDLIDVELDRLAADGLSDRELVVGKGHVKGSLALSLEDTAGRMTRIGRSQLIHGHVLDFDELAARTDAVTQDDIRRVIDRVVNGERVLAVVGPFSDDSFAERVA